MKDKIDRIKYKIEDHMLLGSVYDRLMMRVKYNSSRLSFLYNVMTAQKHRMLYYKKMKAAYWDKCTAERPWEALEKVQNTKTVWVCWMQGIEQAPLLVKRCYESLLKHFPDRQIILLDETKLSDYVKLPDFIIDKWKRGIISMAHFTDLIRLELLIRYGGYWIDATVFCTDGGLLKLIDEEPLFLYSFYYFGFNPEIMETNNWFIHSTANNNVLCLLREFLYAYWKDYDRAVNYFIFQIFMTIALEYYEEEYKKMPIVSQVDAHILATYIFEPYDERKLEILKRSTGFHKLSTRFDKEQQKKPNTFYDVLILQKEKRDGKNE